MADFIPVRTHKEFTISYESKHHKLKNRSNDSKSLPQSDITYDMSTYLRSCSQETLEPINGLVIGKIPTWLNGSLLRNGPGNWKVGDMTFQHVFDCSALVHRFAIQNGKVTYQNRFIQTETLKKNTAAQRIVVSEFGTASVPDPCHSIFDRVSAIFRPDGGTDNTVVSIYPFGDEFFTITESPFMHRINPNTLDTEKRVNVTDSTGFVSQTAHPHILTNGTIYNMGLVPTQRGIAYQIVCFPNSENRFMDAYVKAQLPSSLKLNPSYMHTFGITENYFIIVEQPLYLSLTKMVTAQLLKKGVSACLKWHDNESCIFHLIDRKTGKLAYKFHSDPFFYMHIINQYEEDNHVIIDICCYRNAEVINCMYLESIRNVQTTPDYANLTRCRPLRFILPLAGVDSKHSKPEYKIQSGIGLRKFFSLDGIRTIIQQMNKYKNVQEELPTNLIGLPNTKAQAFKTKNGQIVVRPELLCDVGCELPRFNYKRYSARKYQFFYAMSWDTDNEKPGALIKVDVINNSFKKWYEKDCYPSEPIFVPSPDASAEDDGVVLAAIIWGGNIVNRVGLLVLCAKTWTEMGRSVFETNGPVPRCFHGWYAKDIL